MYLAPLSIFPSLCPVSSGNHSVVCIYEFIVVCFVSTLVTFCFIPPMNEIIWFLSFSVWLILLIIIYTIFNCQLFLNKVGGRKRLHSYLFLFLASHSLFFPQRLRNRRAGFQTLITWDPLSAKPDCQAYCLAARLYLECQKLSIDFLNFPWHFCCNVNRNPHYLPRCTPTRQMDTPGSSLIR